MCGLRQQQFPEPQSIKAIAHAMWSSPLRIIVSALASPGAGFERRSCRRRSGQTVSESSSRRSVSQGNGSFPRVDGIPGICRARVVGSGSS